MSRPLPSVAMDDVPKWALFWIDAVQSGFLFSTCTIVRHAIYWMNSSFKDIKESREFSSFYLVQQFPTVMECFINGRGSESCKKKRGKENRGSGLVWLLRSSSPARIVCLCLYWVGRRTPPCFSASTFSCCCCCFWESRAPNSFATVSLFFSHFYDGPAVPNFVNFMGDVKGKKNRNEGCSGDIGKRWNI